MDQVFELELEWIIFLSDSTVAAMAVMAGLGCGLALSRRYIPFSAAGPWWQRVLRYLAGAAVLLGIYLGLSALFPETSGDHYFLLRFTRYALLGLWIGLGAPWLFVQLHLVDTALPRPQLES
jgi:hypothetical protein